MTDLQEEDIKWIGKCVSEALQLAYCAGLTMNNPNVSYFIADRSYIIMNDLEAFIEVLQSLFNDIVANAEDKTIAINRCSKVSTKVYEHNYHSMAIKTQMIKLFY